MDPERDRSEQDAGANERVLGVGPMLGGMESAQHRVVIEPPAADGRRRVRVGTHAMGVATSTHDVLEFCRRAGLDPDVLQLDDELFDWRGGGPDVWER